MLSTTHRCNFLSTAWERLLCVYAAYVWSYPSHRPCILLVVGGNDVVSDDILPGRNEFHITLTHESRGHARPAHAHDRLCVCVYGWVRVFIRWNIVRCCWYAVDLMRQHFRHVAASVFGASACSLSRDRAAAAHSTANQRLQVVNWGTNCIWIAVAVVVVVVCMLRCGCIQSACVHALRGDIIVEIWICYRVARGKTSSLCITTLVFLQFPWNAYLFLDACDTMQSIQGLRQKHSFELRHAYVGLRVCESTSIDCDGCSTDNLWLCWAGSKFLLARAHIASHPSVAHSARNEPSSS